MNPLGEACNGEDDDQDGAIDEGWPDSDANGRADCLDAVCPEMTLAEAGAMPLEPACVVDGVDPTLPLSDAWDVDMLWQFTAPAGHPEMSWSLDQPVIDNLDDDNRDTVIDEDDVPDVVVNLMDTTWTSSEGGTPPGLVVVLDGATGAEKWTWGPSLSSAGVIIANIDNSGPPELLAYDDEGHVVAIGSDHRTRWTAAREPTGFTYPMVSVADLDGDGTPEVIADDLVLDGPTGAVLFSLDIPMAADPYRIAAVGDIDLDGDQEIAIAGRVFDSDGTLLWDTGERGIYGLWPVIVQGDMDDEAEVGFVGDQWSLWEHDGTPIHAVPYGVSQPGPPCVGDFDGDAQAEIAWPAYDSLVMYELDGTPVWSVGIADASGLSGCSGYDVDGDGALEVLYADEESVGIYDGREGTLRWVDRSHRSETIFEYPVVADIDHDGHAEIVITSNGFSEGWAAVTAFQHAGTGWPAAGSTWAVHDFAITNIGPAGEVPASPDPYWLTYDVYRGRTASDVLALPDLIVEITDACLADCTWGPVKLGVAIANEGGQSVPAGTWLSLYAIDGDERRWVGRWALPALPARTRVEGFELPVTVADLGYDGFGVVIDDNGAGVGVVEECDESDNSHDWTDIRCP